MEVDHSHNEQDDRSNQVSIVNHEMYFYVQHLQTVDIAIYFDLYSFQMHGYDQIGDHVDESSGESMESGDEPMDNYSSNNEQGGGPNQVWIVKSNIFHFLNCRAAFDLYIFRGTKPAMILSRYSRLIIHFHFQPGTINIQWSDINNLFSITYSHWLSHRMLYSIFTSLLTSPFEAPPLLYMCFLKICLARRLEAKPFLRHYVVMINMT